MVTVNKATCVALEASRCPFCSADNHVPWAEENGYHAVRCAECGIVYVTPRPVPTEIDKALHLGQHRTAHGVMDIQGHPNRGKVRLYRKVVSDVFGADIAAGRSVRWLDLGAGFGEFVEALIACLPSGSLVEGIEPMPAKVEVAERFGLPVKQRNISGVTATYDVVSLINVFSHIPDFGSFLDTIKSVLAPGGEIFVETGNAADLDSRSDFPYPLCLPDHLVFAGERHIEHFLKDKGFSLVSVNRRRADGLLNSVRQAIKSLLGSPAQPFIPYTSKYRTVFYRAKLCK